MSHFTLYLRQRWLYLYLLVFCLLGAALAIESPGSASARVEAPTNLPGAQNRQFDFSRLENFINKSLDRMGGGCALLLIQDGKVIYRKAFGEGWTPERVVPIASSTKALSASVILALVDEGKLRLDDKAARYLPQFTGQKAGMTIRQMFSHTSGLSHEPWYDRERNITLAEAADKIAGMPMIGDPGTKLHYGNQSMQAAGRIAEIVSGKPWAELFKEKIAGPLKMQHTDYYAFWETKNPMIGGSVRSNVDDLGNFLLMVMNKGRFQGKQVLSEKAIDEMFRNQSGEVAIGWHPWATYREADPKMATTPYGVGWWLEEWDKKTGKAWAASSGGAFGCQPFVDFKRNLAGVFLPYNRRIGGDAQNRPYNEAHVVYLELRNLLREIIPEKAQGSKSPRSASLTPDSGKGAWRAYGGDNRASKYAPLAQINRDNLHKLRIAWRWETPDGEIVKAHPELRPGDFEATPLMIGGVLYTSTAMSQVAAIEAATGKTIWVYDPGTWKQGNLMERGFLHRGVAWWAAGNDKRIFIATLDARLIALDAAPGKPIASFGAGAGGAGDNQPDLARRRR